MNQNTLINSIRYYWKNTAFNHGFLILIALLGVIVPCWYFDKSSLIIPLVLGVIAAALAESDDKAYGRLKAQAMTIACFIIATFSIELLFDYPVLFAAGLFTSTIGFIMLGAIGPRYAKIAFGSLLIAIYTMLGAHESTNIWSQPLLLITGSIWYFVISFLWNTLFPLQPVQQSLSAVFEKLSEYMHVKRELFHPVSDMSPQPYRIREANLNSATVEALNRCKATFLSRSERGNVDSTSDRFLNIYFIAQDIHERVSSSHYRYQELAELFKRSDILFRFKHILELQAKACLEVAGSIKYETEYQHNHSATLAISELQDSLAHIEESGNPRWLRVVPQIKYLLSNLQMVEKQLANINNPDVRVRQGDQLIEDTEAHTPEMMWERIKSNLSPSSLLFRHAIRLSTALVAGYAVIQQFHMEMGYWILLTILFVCQPNYSATRQKLNSRIIGTAAGLVLGALLLVLFPSQTAQSVFIVLSGVAFFVFRENNYSYATSFITILVLFCFHQHGEGYAVILPRFSDTLVGCLLAVAAVTFILPDWQSRRLHKVMADSVYANRQYLAQIIRQYRVGKKDDLSYRVARRNAHTQGAALSSAINNMLAEPGRYQSAKDESFRFLTLNHALLSYISAMGAHRSRLDNQEAHQLILDAHKSIHQQLEQLYNNLNCESACPAFTQDQSEIESRLKEWRDEQDESVSLVLQQLHLILRMMPELNQLTTKFARCKPAG